MEDLCINAGLQKLVEEFGTKLIDEALLERFERVVGVKPHHYLRRGIVFSHRDLDLILDLYEKKEPFFLYTVSLHLYFSS